MGMGGEWGVMASAKAKQKDLCSSFAISRPQQVPRALLAACHGCMETWQSPWAKKVKPPTCDVTWAKSVPTSEPQALPRSKSPELQVSVTAPSGIQV